MTAIRGPMNLSRNGMCCESASEIQKKIQTLNEKSSLRENENVFILKKKKQRNETK